MKARYTHKLLKQEYILGGEDMDLEKAWNLFSFACRRNGWTEDITLIKVELIKA